MTEFNKNSSIKYFGKTHMNVPVDFFYYARQEKKFTEVAIYLSLVWRFDGPFSFNDDTLSYLSSCLGIKSSKTIKKYVRNLLKIRWIYKTKGKYKLKGFRFIKLQKNFTKKKRILLRFSDFKNYKSFMAAAVITHLMLIKKIKDGRNGQLTGCSASGRFNLPFRYEAKFFGIAFSTARDFIKKAMIDGYIKKKEDKRHLNEPKIVQFFWQEGLEVAPNRVIRRRGIQYEQMPNLYSSTIILR